MCAVFMVVANILRDQSLQMAFIHRDDVVQQFSSAASDPTLRHTVLPGTLEGGSHGLIFNDRTAARTSNPYFASRSKIRNLGADPNGNASRNCWMI
jgi:hypothetical protein